MPPTISFQRTPVTIILMCVMGLIEVLSLTDEGARLRFYQALGLTQQIWGWELWRPFTTTLLHADVLHAAFNIYILSIFGAAIENRYGPGRLLGMVAFFALCSTMPEYAWNYQRQITWIVGFSGVNYGLFGFLYVGRRYQSEFFYACSPMTVQIMIAWFFLCILLTAIDVWNVANVAHGAGFVFGYLLAQSVFRVRGRTAWRAALGVATAAVLLMLVWCPWHEGFKAMKHHRPPYRPLLKRTLEERPAVAQADAWAAEGSTTHSGG
jgi:membrane associated rhomboid family serine protease